MYVCIYIYMYTHKHTHIYVCKRIFYMKFDLVTPTDLPVSLSSIILHGPYTRHRVCPAHIVDALPPAWCLASK